MNDINNITDLNYEVKKIKLEENLYEFNYLFHLKSFDCKNYLNDTEVITIKWANPYIDCAGIWHPKCAMDRSIKADWATPNKTMTAVSAPIVCLFSENSMNRLTFSVSEIKEEVLISSGIHEENGEVINKIAIPFKSIKTKSKYTLKLRVDYRDIPFYKSINAVIKWWEDSCNIIPMESNCITKDTVYSTWYTFHQNLFEKELEEECKKAVNLGIKTLIVDDGWQTDDNNRGYAYCGDWELSSNRFPNFPEHVKKIHELGMKYLLWYSVPFIGIKSKVWEEFKDKLIIYNSSLEAGVVDIRYKVVREYLIEIYKTAMIKWDIDGFKLDFIDQIYEKESTPPYNECMDYESIQDALDVFLKEIKSSLKNIKENVMIEFRQNYIGPNMRSYGNMLRVQDCPLSAISNRVGVIDLRLTSGSTAVHSDMIMWNKEESIEVVALQLIASLFSVLQISVNLSQISREHEKVLKFWINFMSEKRNLLLESSFKPLEPHNLYPVVWVTKEDEALAVVYSENKVLKINHHKKIVIVVNGTQSDFIYLDIEEDTSVVITILDCKGDVLESNQNILLKKLHKFYLKTAGLIIINFHG